MGYHVSPQFKLLNDLLLCWRSNPQIFNRTTRLPFYTLMAFLLHLSTTPLSEHSTHADELLFINQEFFCLKNLFSFHPLLFTYLTSNSIFRSRSNCNFLREETLQSNNVPMLHLFTVPSYFSFITPLIYS